MGMSVVQASLLLTRLILHQHRSVPAPRLKPTSHLPSSILNLCPAVLSAELSLCPAGGDQGGCKLRQALMSSHSCWYPCTAPLASQHITSRELAYLYPAGFPIASTEVLQGIQEAFSGLNTLNFCWSKKQSRWCPDWEQLTFDVF